MSTAYESIRNDIRKRNQKDGEMKEYPKILHMFGGAQTSVSRRNKMSHVCCSLTEIVFVIVAIGSRWEE